MHREVISSVSLVHSMSEQTKIVNDVTSSVTPSVTSSATSKTETKLWSGGVYTFEFYQGA
jgi:hypothetical protein